MAIKKIKRAMALLAAVTMMVTSIPNTIYAASVDLDETAVDGNATDDNTAGEDSVPADENDDQMVTEDGEVVMDGAIGKIDESEWITLADYELITESDTYKMYLYEPRLSIILENKKTGEILESTLSDEKDDGNSNKTWNAYMKSAVVIQAIVGTNNTYQVDLVSCKNTTQVTKTANGFSAKVYFTEYQFGLTLEVSLENDELVVNVPDDSIVEDKAGSYISSISLYPFMGYTFLDEEDGYMLIPDGNGALIYLDSKEGRYTTGFSQMIYGGDRGFVDTGTYELLWDSMYMINDQNQVIAPVFGMAHANQQLGYLAVVEQGEKRASIESHPNGAMVNYNRCFAKFLLRDVYVQPLNNSNSGTVTEVETDRTHTDLSVRYLLLEGDAADYSGMAVTYRNYLLNNDLVDVKDTAYNTRVDFLGTDREQFLMSTKAVTVTTVENIEEMFGEFQADGIDSMLTVYKGWQKGGIFNFPITKYKADSHIGGTKALTNLISESAEKNYQVYLNNDALRVNPDTNKFTFNTAKRVNKRTMRERTYSNVYDEYYYLTPMKTTSILTNFTKSYTKKGVTNLALEGITNKLFSYSNKGSYYTRYDCAESYENVIASVSEDANLILQQPFAYLWRYTGAFLDMPLGSSDYMYVDEEVPFLSMVLKGIMPMYSEYTNFEANKTEFFLQMVESGVYPSFYLTYENSSKLIYTNSSDLYSTEYSTYKDAIKSYDEQLRELAGKVQNAYIINHEKMDNGVTAVTYDNGILVYVNYTDKDQTVNGITVTAMSYKVGEAK